MLPMRGIAEERREIADKLDLISGARGVKCGVCPDSDEGLSDWSRTVVRKPQNHVPSYECSIFKQKQQKPRLSREEKHGDKHGTLQEVPWRAGRDPPEARGARADHGIVNPFSAGLPGGAGAAVLPVRAVARAPAQEPAEEGEGVPQPRQKRLLRRPSARPEGHAICLQVTKRRPPSLAVSIWSTALPPTSPGSHLVPRPILHPL